MNIGELYFDKSRQPLETKIAAIADEYRLKFGKRPDLVFVHPTEATASSAAGLEVRPMREIRRNHYWIGVKDE